MQIERVRARGFRNLEPFDLSLHPRMVLVRGQNAQGKTNLLEALYLCATGRSFRQASPGEMLGEGREAADVEAVFLRRGVRHAIEVKLRAHQRLVRVDDKPLKRLAALLELVNVVAFFPDDLRIAKGSPEERRHFLDRMVANQRPGFIEASLGYLKALRSRNALLKRQDGGGFDVGLLESFDEPLVRYGTEIHESRHAVLREVVPLAQTLFRETMPQSELTVALEGGLKEHGASTDYAAAFREALMRARRLDRIRGMTSVGPHRADLVFRIDGREARAYGSQGQQRTIVLAMKLAEVRRIDALYGAAPILLLDDVSSELDAERSRLLFDAIRGMEGQVWVSSTGAAPLPIGDDAQVLEVEAGRILPLREAP